MKRTSYMLDLLHRSYHMAVITFQYGKQGGVLLDHWLSLLANLILDDVNGGISEAEVILQSTNGNILEAAKLIANIKILEDEPV